MPDNISNTIIFDAVHADKVFAECCPDRELDFNTLIPVPLYIYQGDVGKEKIEEFGEDNTWLGWNCKHWGTKWNAYDSICSIHGDKAYICFNTAWSIPQPIIIAFANKFGISFEYQYLDEGECFWGIEEWSDRKRTLKRYMQEADLKLLKE